MSIINGRHVVALEVITGTNIPVPDRTPVGYYVHVATSNGWWNTTIKAAEAGPPEPTHPWERNFVIFSKTGSGMFINAIMQKQLAKTSIDTQGYTSTPEHYPVEISSKKYVLVGTPAFNEPSEGTAPDAKAKNLLKGLLCELMSSRLDDIGLLVYCMHSMPHPSTFDMAHKLYSMICHNNKVPIILVVKEWRDEQAMENWWNTHGSQCESAGMDFTNNPSNPTSKEIDHPRIPEDITYCVTESSCYRYNNSAGCRAFVGLSVLCLAAIQP
ncbi:hypothetical protein BDR03DRAFT_980077 [Suillus americanus]|nr:hypothetical protein BDR03DRAFT_980077 [Suillus americanus]